MEIYNAPIFVKSNHKEKKEPGRWRRGGRSSKWRKFESHEHLGSFFRSDLTTESQHLTKYIIRIIQYPIGKSALTFSRHWITWNFKNFLTAKIIRADTTLETSPVFKQLIFIDTSSSQTTILKDTVQVHVFSSLESPECILFFLFQMRHLKTSKKPRRKFSLKPAYMTGLMALLL